MEDSTNYEKEIALSFLKELVAKSPSKVRSSPEIGFGPKTLTIEQLVSEVVEGTVEGKWIIKAVNGLIKEFQINAMLRGEDKK
jgi:hypothetical protein